GILNHRDVLAGVFAGRLHAHADTDESVSRRALVLCETRDGREEDRDRQGVANKLPRVVHRSTTWPVLNVTDRFASSVAVYVAVRLPLVAGFTLKQMAVHASLCATTRLLPAPQLLKRNAKSVADNASVFKNV